MQMQIVCSRMQIFFRHFVILNTEGDVLGSFVSGRPRANHHPKLVLIKSKIRDQIMTLTLTTQDNSRVQINLREVRQRRDIREIR